MGQSLPLLVVALLFLSAGVVHATGSVFPVLGASLFLVLVFSIKLAVFCVMEMSSRDRQPPVAGLTFNQLIHFRGLFDYMTFLARKHRTFRLIEPFHSEIYTVDPANVEYILKTNFSNYIKGDYNCGIMRDLFGQGIFAVDGEKWRHQRKLASHEFSTRNLRNFSSTVFRTNAVKLVSKVATAAEARQPMNMQDLLMKSTLDSIFKRDQLKNGTVNGGKEDILSRFLMECEKPGKHDRPIPER
ncbi:hypothetical protein MLD38_029107 [Melastoma candidum]|uniref:Uncharacterized protein n=1 Tax=Melastoma candidum TaxID=119954 RepID=A0ACB9N333_9MYRT|nr:hypothetical protein MLD38_029107 [Melastoma candidum]